MCPLWPTLLGPPLCTARVGRSRFRPCGLPSTIANESHSDRPALLVRLCSERRTCFQLNPIKDNSDEKMTRRQGARWRVRVGAWSRCCAVKRRRSLARLSSLSNSYDASHESIVRNLSEHVRASRIPGASSKCGFRMVPTARDHVGALESIDIAACKGNGRMDPLAVYRRAKAYSARPDGGVRPRHAYTWIDRSLTGPWVGCSNACECRRLNA